MAQLLVPLDALFPELLPMFGEVLIVQLKGFPSGSCIVTLSEEVVIGIAMDPFAGLGLVIVGGLLTGAACVVKL